MEKNVTGKNRLHGLILLGIAILVIAVFGLTSKRIIWLLNNQKLTPSSIQPITFRSTTLQDGMVLPQNLILSPGVLLEDFEMVSEWKISSSADGGTAIDDKNTFKTGTQSIQLTTPPGSGSISIARKVNWDLSPTKQQGNFQFWVYCADTTEPIDFQLLISNDENFENYYIGYYNESYKFHYLPGWNHINMRTEDWIVGDGSPSWEETIRLFGIRFFSEGVHSLNIDSLYSGVETQAAILLTFDDGPESQYSEAYSYMKNRNVLGTIYPVIDWINDDGFLTWAELTEMYKAGWTIGSHSKNHPDLTKLTEVQQETQMRESQAALLSSGITERYAHFAYPFGFYNSDTLNAMENSGQKTGRTIHHFNVIMPLANNYELPGRETGAQLPLETAKKWVDTAIARGEVAVIVIHRILSNPSNADWHTDRFEGLVDYCIERDVPIITMNDLYQLQSSSVTIPLPK